jgi:hypothetical protein
MFNHAPSLYTLEAIVHIAEDPEALSEHSSGQWVPARYMGKYGVRNRLKLAIMVFTGKADAVVWPGGQ